MSETEENVEVSGYEARESAEAQTKYEIRGKVLCFGDSSCWVVARECDFFEFQVNPFRSKLVVLIFLVVIPT